MIGALLVHGWFDPRRSSVDTIVSNAQVLVRNGSARRRPRHVSSNAPATGAGRYRSAPTNWVPPQNGLYG